MAAVRHKAQILVVMLMNAEAITYHLADMEGV
jgi:hypothetical protein